MRTIAKILLLSIMTMSMIACGKKESKDESKEAQASTETMPTLAAGMYSAADDSNIKWTGKKPTGEHYGHIPVTEGKFEIADNMIKSGQFVLDMNAVTVDDIPADDEMHGKLLGHLKSPDFFGVEAHPTATFTIQNVAMKDGAYEVTGELALKDSVQAVTFPANIESHDGDIHVKAMFEIDRTKWGVHYGSKSIFDDLGDKFINDDVALELHLKATPKAEESNM